MFLLSTRFWLAGTFGPPIGPEDVQFLTLCHGKYQLHLFARAPASFAQPNTSHLGSPYLPTLASQIQFYILLVPDEHTNFWPALYTNTSTRQVTINIALPAFFRNPSGFVLSSDTQKLPTEPCSSYMDAWGREPGPRAELDQHYFLPYVPL
ncbi:hypothetical protein B0H10DRAFT_1961093 [Mycena sp. CBHHK59/15]|nr:hypothetical protein B0H10DRAFT_1961093 [Mycena sp. CBHHK59/15]